MRYRALVAALLMAASVGAEEAAYLVAGDTLPVPVVANGYVQDVTIDHKGVAMVRVSTSLSPIGAVGANPARLGHVSPGVPAGFQLPLRLEPALRRETDAWTAATRVLEWVADRVQVDTEDRGPQDATSVLRRRSGRCSGLANATAALLMAAGFEARTVSGLLVDDEVAIPHRWVECRLPEVGWVPSDPTLGLWVVTPRHMVFGDAVARPPAVQVLKIEANGLARLPRRNGRPLRPNQGTGLVCRLVGEAVASGAMAVLRGQGGEEQRALLNPEARFSGLLPGHWSLIIVADDGIVLERTRVELRAGEVHSLIVEIPTRGGRSG